MTVGVRSAEKRGLAADGKVTETSSWIVLYLTWTGDMAVTCSR